MFVSKRDRSFLRPDKRDMGSAKLSKAYAFAMRDAIGSKADESDAATNVAVDTGKAVAYKQYNKFSK